MSKEDLLEKWLREELTDAENTAFNQLNDASLNKAIVDAAENFKASNFSKIEDFNAFEKKHILSVTSPKKKPLWQSPFIRIAAVLVIALGLFFTIFSNNEVTLETLASQKMDIELPDQSQVALNALSEISYNSKDWKNNRSLKLKGEAYFKVAKGSTFDVVTKDGIVTVVGTEFNVKQRDNYFEVICFEGVVNVKTDQNQQTLKAGDSFLFLNNNYSKGKTTLLSPDWTANKSNFNAIPLSEVLAELERQYSIEITHKNSDINRLFSGSFTHNNLEEALKSITLPMNLTYEFNTSNLVVIHGNTN